MLIFLYGKDNYRAREKLREIIEHYKKVHKTGLNFKLFEGKEFPFEDFENESKTSSMFKEKKLTILKNIFSDKKNQEKFIEILKGLKQADDIILIFEEGKPDSRTLLYKFLKKHSKSQEFEPLGGATLEKWLKDQFVKLGADITQEALGKLILSVGNDSWQLSNEVKKLASFKRKGKVEAKDVDLLVKPRIESDIFNFSSFYLLFELFETLWFLYHFLKIGPDINKGPPEDPFLQISDNCFYFGKFWHLFHSFKTILIFSIISPGVK